MSNIFDLSSLSDLPRDLRDDLKVTKRDEYEQKLIDLFEKAERPLTLDEVMVGYYRLYREVLERSKLNTKLYNMSRARYPAIESVEGKKGVYTLRQEAVAEKATKHGFASQLLMEGRGDDEDF